MMIPQNMVVPLELVDLVILGTLDFRDLEMPRDQFIRTRGHDQVRDGCWRCTPRVQVIWSQRKPS